MNSRILGFIALSLISQSVCGQSTAEEEALKTIRFGMDANTDPMARAIRALHDGMVDPTESAARKLEITSDIEALKKEPTPQQTLAELAREKKIEEDQEAQQEIDALKWENTLLTSPSGYVGFYKADFIKIGLLAAEFIADAKLYKELTKRRIDHVTHAMIADVDMFLAVLKRVHESEIRFEERVASLSAVALMFTDIEGGRRILLNPLRRYLTDKHCMTNGYVPFNRETILPLCGRWLFEKVLDYTERELLVPSIFAEPYQNILKKFKNPRLQENIDARRFAYTPNQAGYLAALKAEEAPFAASTVLKALIAVINPLKALEKLTYSDTSNPWLGRLGFANKVAGFGLPRVLFSDPVRLAMEIMGMGYAAQYHDSCQNAQWANYVLANKDELYRLLLAYRKTLDNAASGEVAIAQRKQELRDFVVAGHASSNMLPGSALSQWWTVRNEGRSHVHTLLGCSTAALLLLKIGHWWITAEAPHAREEGNV